MQKLDDTFFTRYNITSYAKAKFFSLVSFIREYTPYVSQRGLEWFAIVLFHCASLPSTISFLLGIIDHMPGVEVVLFTWVGLIVYFFKSFLENNRIMIFTNAMGFFIQAAILAMVVYQ